MGRPSKLTEKQWDEALKAVLNGESQRSVAARYGISNVGLRKRLGSQSLQVKETANQIAIANTMLDKLPVNLKMYAQEMAYGLQAISNNLLRSAKHGAESSAKLAAMAALQLDQIKDVENPMDDQDKLQAFGGLTKMAIDSAKLGVDLINANKKGVDAIQEDDEEATGLDWRA